MEWHLRSIYKRVETNRTKCVERIRQCSFEISGASPIGTYKFLLVLPTSESYVTTDVIIISDKEVPLFTPTPYYIILRLNNGDWVLGPILIKNFEHKISNEIIY